MGSRAHVTTSSGRRGALPALQLAAAGNSSSSVAIWVSIKFPVKIASKALFDAGVTGAGGGGTPILCMSRTSPRFDAGMCASFCAVILELLVWMGCRRTGGFCFSRLDSNGERRVSCTSSVKCANRLAALFRVGVAWFGS